MSTLLRYKSFGSCLKMEFSIVTSSLYPELVCIFCVCFCRCYVQMSFCKFQFQQKKGARPTFLAFPQMILDTRCAWNVTVLEWIAQVSGGVSPSSRSPVLAMPHPLSQLLRSLLFSAVLLQSWLWLLNSYSIFNSCFRVQQIADRVQGLRIDDGASLESQEGGFNGG